ncbi:acyltransferase family protein [Streptococcus sp. DD12]|uniref:acyltransferase family protein n=1 Tax=Streptococcus sp. DD12 TaxID=1777880 RepID=UPI000793F895|nr:acyltransferase family protein [Streptococcus sp. DD12]KXT76048.1 Acyltransferase family [Streptococcus sp. DD12]
MRIQWFSFVRVIGLSLVLLYHFFTGAFPGGFIGVDVFFTFSGFLITALLIDEHQKQGKIDLLGYLRRRFYRIVPPLLLSILISLPFTFLVRNDYIASIGRQLTAALGFMTNFYEILTGGSYESNFVPHLFVHTWSLAIEVHFYLLWGLLLWYLAKRVKSPQAFRSLVFLSSLVFLGLSLLTMVIGASLSSNLSSVYFSTFSHIFPFFIGSVTATVSGVRETTARFKRNVGNWSLKRTLSVMGLATVILLVLTFALDFNARLTYYVGFFLASLFSALFIYAARLLNDQLPNRKEPQVITYIANISYAVYLFHWPLFTILSQVTTTFLAVVLTLLLCLLFSTLSYYVIEPMVIGKTPAFMGVSFDLSPYKKYFYGATGLLVLAMLVVLVRAPKVGAFEANLTTNTIKQEQNTMNKTRQLADSANATSYNVPAGVTIIGDSVALRASDWLNSSISNVSVDAAVNRNLDEALSILQTDAQNNALAQDVVIATGVNTVNDYKSSLDQIVASLPKGHHLVFVTPYDGRYITSSDAVVNQTANYMRELAQKYDYISVADWNQVAQTNSAIWVGTDGVHFGSTSDSISTGATLYVQTLQAALTEVNSKPLKTAA